MSEQPSDDPRRGAPASRPSGRDEAAAGASDRGGADDVGSGSAPGGPTPERTTPVTQQIGRVVVVLLVVLFGVFAAVNAQPVDFSWVFGATEVSEPPTGGTEGGVPLIVLLLAAFAVGALAGVGLVWQGRRSRRRRSGGAGEPGARPEEPG